MDTRYALKYGYTIDITFKKQIYENQFITLHEQQTPFTAYYNKDNSKETLCSNQLVMKSFATVAPRGQGDRMGIISQMLIKIDRKQIGNIKKKKKLVTFQKGHIIAS